MKLLKDEVFAQLLNDDGTPTQFLFSNKGRVFSLKTMSIYDCPLSKDYVNIHGKKYKIKPRRHITVFFNGESYTCQLARAIMLAFNRIPNYKEMEVDHLDGNPLNNNLDNLEWVTHEENHKRAVEMRLLPYGEDHHNSKYSDELVHNICQDICDKVPRKEIKKKYGVNGQLIDDIRSGRSHRYISELYVDKGFEYKVISQKERDKRARKVRKICKLIDEGYTNKEIYILLDLPKNEICLPNDIRKFRIYKKISKDYDFANQTREI